MKRVLIIPYFGDFPNYFQLFLNSCEKNLNYTWFIFTDNTKKYNYPKNVKIFKISFEELKKLFQNKFDFKISLETPYKLCDFKPCYGYIFEEYIKGYNWWGHCDVDLIFGDLDKFISNEMLEQYEKLFSLGHFTLYKNTKENNRRFMKPFKGNFFYKKYLSQKGNFIFDELYTNSINNIYEELKIPYLDKIFCADIYTKSSNFKIVKGFNRKDKKYILEIFKKNLFTYENGKIFEYYIKNNELVKKEYMYIHLQKRKMDIKINENKDCYKIIPNAFENMEYKNIDLNNFYKIKKKNFNLHYFKLRKKNLFIKIKKYIKNL